MLRPSPDGLVLTEIAPGADLHKDLLPKLEFRPKVAAELKEMEPPLFKPEPMQLAKRLKSLRTEFRSAGPLHEWR